MKWHIREFISEVWGMLIGYLCNKHCQLNKMNEYYNYNCIKLLYRWEILAHEFLGRSQMEGGEANSQSYNIKKVTIKYLQHSFLKMIKMTCLYEVTNHILGHFMQPSLCFFFTSGQSWQITLSTSYLWNQMDHWSLNRNGKKTKKNMNDWLITWSSWAPISVISKTQHLVFLLLSYITQVLNCS